MESNSSCLAFCKFLTEKEEWTILEFLLSSFESFVAILTVLGNLLVFIVFLREKSLRREFNFYIISLAFGDFCVGLISIPLYLHKIDHTEVPENCHIKFCIFKMATLMTLSNVSVFNLVLISIKRLRVLSVKHPNIQPESTKKILLQISIVWTLAIAIGTAPLYSYNNNPEKCQLKNILKMEFIICRFIVATVVPVTIMVHVYYNICKMIMELAKKNQDSHRPINPPEQNTNRAMDKEVKATISIAIIVLVYCFTWIPSQILYVVSIFFKGCIPHFVVHLVMTLLLLNSAINPIIYAFRMRDIRKAIYKLFRIDRSLAGESSYAGTDNVGQ